MAPVETDRANDAIYEPNRSSTECPKRTNYPRPRASLWLFARSLRD